MDGIVDDAIISGLLKQILMEVKSSNEMLSQKVSELEKVCELQDDTPIPKKRKKLSPSREVRVSMLCYLVVCSPVYCYTPYDAGCGSQGISVLDGKRRKLWMGFRVS